MIPKSEIRNPKSNDSVIRVLLVDDSPLVLHVLQRILSTSSEIMVVGTAANGKEALELLPELKPDVICTDLHMPVMDGLEFTRQVMASNPIPILVVSVSVEPGADNVFRLLEAGAVDVYPKPSDIINGDKEKLSRELVSKLRILSGVRVFRRKNPQAMVEFKAVEALRHQAYMRIVVIGASTGGPQALQEVLKGLPENFSLPLVCVQHIGCNFLDQLVLWLNETCSLSVRKAVSGEVPQAGVVYFAPEGTHLEWDESGRFLLSHMASIEGHMPSVSVTMSSAARYYGAATVGVLLTGMGSDGASGMLDIARAGGVTIAQDEASCVVYGMPKQAVLLGAVQQLLPLEQIASALTVLANNERNI